MIETVKVAVCEYTSDDGGKVTVKEFYSQADADLFVRDFNKTHNLPVGSDYLAYARILAH